jgi:hypothetical protein
MIEEVKLLACVAEWGPAGSRWSLSESWTA